ncbi:MAG: BON domain-containing protein [Burkholderiales bacterium]|nr:BON domain-containing protein [Burkholderiales bacterium]
MRFSAKRLMLLALVTLATPLLSGCFTLAATGIVATAVSVDDRRSTGFQVEDESIEWKAAARIREQFKDTHIIAVSYNLSVLLVGQVPTEDVKKQAEMAIRGIPNVKNVVNELTVAGNTSIAARANDGLITTNVKARMVGNGRVSPNHVKVVTENSVVYLLGIVTEAEGNAATDIARTTSGVSRVVKVFEYIAAAPAAPAAPASPASATPPATPAPATPAPTTTPAPATKAPVATPLKP